MKIYTIVLLLAAVVFVECGNTFIGTNVMRPLVYHKDTRYSSKIFQKRVETLQFTLPPSPYGYSRSIQGIMAYDLTHSGASANVTSGGIGFNYVNLRMKSDRNKDIHYDIYIYA